MMIDHNENVKLFNNDSFIHLSKMNSNFDHEKHSI